MKMSFNHKKIIRDLRRWGLAIHRDFGFFFSGLIIIYCISGMALNHIDEWNPDFIIKRNVFHFKGDYSAPEITPKDILAFSHTVGQEQYKVYDSPVPDQIKIYYDNASLHLDFSRKTAVYEHIQRRPLFYSANVLHKNSLKGWKWCSDAFAVMLILITVTGMIILKGKKGISGRGKWLVLAGFVPPLLVLTIDYVLAR